MAVSTQEQVASDWDVIHLLDDVVLEGAWALTARLALHELALALAPDDAAILAHLRGHASTSLEEKRGGRAGSILQIPEGAAKRSPVLVALLIWSCEAPGPALTSLTAILINAALGPEGRDPAQRSRIKELARYVRVAIEEPGAPLRVVVAGADGVTSLLRHLDRMLAEGDQSHQTFNRLWRNWLRHRVARWIHAEPGRLSRALGSRPELVVAIEAPSLPVAGSSADDLDDQIELPASEVSGAAFEGLGARSIYALANAQRLLRKSGDPGLSLSPDQIVPEGLVRRAAHATLGAGQAAIAAGHRVHAEQFLGLGFAIATGMREVDLSQVRWGCEGGGDVVLDLDAPVLWLRLKRPPQAKVPPANLVPHLKPSTEVIHWPLPPSLHEALKTLRYGSSSPDGLVFPLGQALGGAYRLRDVVSRLLPGVQMGAGPFRNVLATHLTSSFGPEVAQLVMRDTFSTSLGPAYYGWIPENIVMLRVSGLLASWYDEHVPHLATRTAGIGSRIAVQDELARQWPAALAREAYSAARRKEGRLSYLLAQRNHLAAALCVITGIRPGECIGSLMLDSVVPEYCLVILEDKQVDVLRRTRVAATGRRWRAALGEYLHRLAEISCGEDAALAEWATGVLQSEQPLFSALTESGTVQRLEMGALSVTMPAVLAQVSNHYRHRLNQLLQERNIDWELRHAQLGWVVSPSFALADLSPLSAQSFGEQLGEVIDELVVEEGWYSRGQRTPEWSWAGLPSRPFKDWDAEIRHYEQEHAVYVRGVREAFVARRRESEDRVFPRLAEAIAELIPALDVDKEQRELVISPGFGLDGPVPLSFEHYALIRDRIRKDDDDPASALEALAAEYLIHQLVMQAIERKIVSGPEPPRRHLGVTAQLSPFLPGIGLAVRHAEAIRARLVEVAAEDRPHDKPGLVQLSMLATTPHRDIEAASSIVAAAAKVMRGSSQREWLRVPARQDRREVPMVVAGCDALVLARRGMEAPTGKPLPVVEFAAWVQKRFGDVVEFDGDATKLLERIVGTLRTAGRVELSGPERLVMEGQPVAAVDTQRMLAVADEWPLRTGAGDEDDARHLEQIKEPYSGSKKVASKGGSAAYRKLTSALNPEVSRRRGRESDNKYAWRGRLRKELDVLLDESGQDSNLGLIIQYFIHRLVHRGGKGRGRAQKTLHKELTRFGSVLLSILGRRLLAEQPSQELQEIYLAVLCSKTESTRPEVLEELVKFHRYLATVHHVEDVDFSPLRAFAGPRIRTADIGALSREEVGRVLLELQNDLEHESLRTDAGPEDVRACALRVLMYLILEASAVRPNSAHGLVLGDLHLLRSGEDFVHVHQTGEYGAAKTTTSVGFVRLEGELWAANREWVVDWLDKERTLGGEAWWRLPVFAESPGSRRRFVRNYLTRRVDSLLKWASGQPRARTYWLRKRRVTLRIGAAMNQQMATARDVYRALRESGHADILTPLGHYIYDAAVPLAQYLKRAGRLDRASVLAMSGVSASALDAAWHRQRLRDSTEFHGVVLDRIGVEVAPIADESVTDPPMLYRQKVLTPRHIDVFAREYHRHGDKLDAMRRSGLSSGQVERLEREIEALVVQNGFAPWEVAGIRQRRGVMAPARRIEGTAKLFQLMDDPPVQWLWVLAEAWQDQGYVHRLHDSDVVLVLEPAAVRNAAEEMLIRTDLNLQIEVRNQGKAVLVTNKNDKERKNSHASGVRWMLAMIWLYQRLLDHPSMG